MRIPRIYLPVELIPGRSIELDEQSAHHIRSVLRLKSGEAVRLFNGSEFEYEANISQLSGRSVKLEVGQVQRWFTESPLAIHFGLGISRGERMDFAIQKSVELGVRTITPIFTERTVVRLDHSGATRKQLHWQRIAINAAEQCGRTRVPEILEPVSLQSWLQDCLDLKIFLDPVSHQTIQAMTANPSSVYLLSGPEGGFAAHERKRVLNAGFVGVNLGPRILRTETAALVGITLIQSQWGDLGITLPER